MADFLVLKREPNGTPGPKGWKVINYLQGKTADATGATEALKESYNGPGRYGVLRCDNGRTSLIQDAPTFTDDPAPSWQ